MKRREFIPALGSAVGVAYPNIGFLGFLAIAGSPEASAQQPGIPTIGFLNLGWERDYQRIVDAFRSGLADFGYAEGKNIRVLYRFANGNADDLSTLTVELASLGAAVIVTNNTTTIRAAHNAAPHLPIVVWAGADPVMMGWAQSLTRPGGMITGAFEVGTVGGKRLELLKEALPQATVFGHMLNVAGNPGNPRFRSSLLKASDTLGIRAEHDCSTGGRSSSAGQSPG